MKPAEPLRPEIRPTEARIAFARFPFFTGAIEGDGAGQPASLPFALDIHPRYAVPHLAITPEIEAALDAAYGAGSMLSTPLGHGALSQARLEEMATAVRARLGGSVTGRRILEIGCGTGGLLRTLREGGAEVMGCEIGPQAEEAARRYGIGIVQEPLRPGLFDTPFDAVISYGCLEHIADLAGLFAAIRASLAPGGLTLHSVPNSGPFFEGGHVGHLAHQHVHYFTDRNLPRLLAAQGFARTEAAPSAAGNELQAWGYSDPGAPLGWPGESDTVMAEERAMLNAAAGALHSVLTRQIAAVERRLDDGRRIGFYAGGHVLASLGGFAGRLRFYDGDKRNHGRRWLPGFPTIAAPEELAADPDDTVVVCASHHFAAIRDRLADLGLPAAVELIPLAALS